MNVEHRNPVGSLDKNALETEITQLKDNITSFRIQNDGYKIKIANQTRRYLKLSKVSTHSRNTSNEKIAALNADIAKIKPSGSGSNVSGPKTPEQPKVLAPGMYAISSRYITPPRLHVLRRFLTMLGRQILPLLTELFLQWKTTGRQFILCDIYGPKKSKAPIAKPLELSLSVCSRHMTGDRSKLINYVEKFVGTVRFGNDQFALIVGYGDYKMGD
nr:integrase, catalytic region, zinc finger, CCHC-type, peptidase aspartic, catalytic [Tanacetum cinerariifolium]